MFLNARGTLGRTTLRVVDSPGHTQLAYSMLLPLSNGLEQHSRCLARTAADVADAALVNSLEAVVKFKHVRSRVWHFSNALTLWLTRIDNNTANTASNDSHALVAGLE